MSRYQELYVEREDGKRDPRIFIEAVNTFWALARHLEDLSTARCPYPNRHNTDDYWEMYENPGQDNLWELKSKLEQKGLWPIPNWTHNVITTRKRRVETFNITLIFPDTASDKGWQVEVSVSLSLVLAKHYARAFVEFTLFHVDRSCEDLHAIKRLHENNFRRDAIKIKYGYGPGMWIAFRTKVQYSLDPQRFYHQQALKVTRRIILALPNPKGWDALYELYSPDHYAAYLLLCAGGDLRGDKKKRRSSRVSCTPEDIAQ